jgi:hypothetical protein
MVVTSILLGQCLVCFKMRRKERCADLSAKQMEEMTFWNKLQLPMGAFQYDPETKRRSPRKKKLRASQKERTANVRMKLITM